ncbi:histidinol-phosphatase HisJ family protein [Candidatus Harpocratesius sp.]
MTPTNKISHRPFRLFESLTPQWDHDLHIHTNWSQDNLNGPSALKWLNLSERYKIHIGFADHFEIGYYIHRPPKYADLGSWKLNLNTIDNYLEEFDDLKSKFQHFSLGLEVSYHPSIQDRIWEFLDDYYSQFDYITGSVHEIELFRAITVKKNIQPLIQNQVQFKSLIDRYFKLIQEMIDSKRFDVIAHPDVIFRFVSFSTLSKEIQNNYRRYLFDIAWLCDKTKTFMEINLSGYRYQWQDSFPKESLLAHFRLEDIPMVIGSDSHEISYFSSIVPKIRKLNNLLKNNWKFVYKFDPSQIQ